MITRRKIDTSNEVDLIIGLVISDRFCDEIIPILELPYIEVEYVRIVASWIIDYYKEYKCSPKKDILKIYKTNILSITDEYLRDNILSFIQNCNNSETTNNIDYLIDKSISYLKKKSLENLSKTISSYLVNDKIDDAEQFLIKYKKVEKNSGESVSLLDDYEKIINAYNSEEEKLFSLPGAYGKVVGDIHREDFIGFLAPMKAGKTWLLIDVAIEAIKNGLKVAFFSLEMNEKSMIKRCWSCLSGQFLTDINVENYPYFEENEDGKFVLKFKKLSKKASSTMDIQKKQKQLKKLFRGGALQIFCYPTNSLSVEKLSSKLDELEQNKFIADVVIVDYADIMMASDRNSSYRDQLDGIWKRLRALAQSKKIAIFTASQTTRGAINREVEVEDVAEDIRKIAHITSMVSISKTRVYKKHNILVLSQMAVREGAAELRKVVCTQCLDIGRPVVDSKFKDEVIFEFNDEKSEKEIKRIK